MKGKLLGWIALIGLMLIPLVFCCGVAFADDGSAADSDWSPLWIAIGAVAWILLGLYWDCLKPVLSEIWSEPADGVAWKLRQSLIAAAVSVWDMLKAAYKKGLLGAIISILIGIIKRKFGLPAAARAAGKVFKK